VVRQLVSPEDLVGSEAEIAVDDGDRHAAVRLRRDLVLEDLLHVSSLGRVHRPVPLRGMIASRLDRSRGHQQLRALVDHRPADVDVVEEHVRCHVVADIRDLVAQHEPGLAHARLHAAAKQQLLAEIDLIEARRAQPPRSRK